MLIFAWTCYSDTHRALRDVSLNQQYFLFMFSSIHRHVSFNILFTTPGGGAE